MAVEMLLLSDIVTHLTLKEMKLQMINFVVQLSFCCLHKFQGCQFLQ